MRAARQQSVQHTTGTHIYKDNQQMIDQLQLQSNSRDHNNFALMEIKKNSIRLPDLVDRTKYTDKEIEILSKKNKKGWQKRDIKIYQ